jgi:hypothetical protein
MCLHIDQSEYKAGSELAISLVEIVYRVAQKPLDTRCLTTERPCQVTSVPFCVLARYCLRNFTVSRCWLRNFLWCRITEKRIIMPLLMIYRVYTKEWCGLNSEYYWNRTILLCIPCIIRVKTILNLLQLFSFFCTLPIRSRAFQNCRNKVLLNTFTFMCFFFGKANFVTLCILYTFCTMNVPCGYYKVRFKPLINNFVAS